MMWPDQLAAHRAAVHEFTRDLLALSPDPLEAIRLDLASRLDGIMSTERMKELCGEIHALCCHLEQKLRPSPV